jgi:hypothetical protein
MLYKRLSTNAFKSPRQVNDVPIRIIIAVAISRLSDTCVFVISLVLKHKSGGRTKVCVSKAVAKAVDLVADLKCSVGEGCTG